MVRNKHEPKSMEWHRETGAELSTICENLRLIRITCGLKKTHKAIKLMSKISDLIQSLRFELEGEAFRQHPADATVYVYFPRNEADTKPPLKIPTPD